MGLWNVIILHILKLDWAPGDRIIAYWPQHQISFRFNISSQNLLPTSTLNQPRSQRSFSRHLSIPNGACLAWVVNSPSSAAITHPKNIFAISLFLYHYITICICHLYHFCADRKCGKLHETIYCCSSVHEASLLSPKSKLGLSHVNNMRGPTVRP